jgi:hypothetical protein
MIKEGYLVRDKTIIIERELTELDKFLRDFLEVMKKHLDYLVVSGFVSISTGRIRGTEDIDVLFMISEKKIFDNFFKEVKKKKFWCYQTDSSEEAYKYIKNYDSISFAREREIFPNIEMIPITSERKAKYFEFSNPQKIKIGKFEFKIPWIEFEITYKEKILKGKKDLEDAMHLRTFFSKILSEDRFKKSEEVIKSEIQKRY